MADSRETFTIQGAESEDELESVADAVRDLDGIQGVDTDSDSGEVSVRYGEELVSGERIKDAARDLGYEVE